MGCADNPIFDAERQLFRAALANDGWRPPRRAGRVQIRGSFLASLIAGRPRAEWIAAAAGGVVERLLHGAIVIDGDERLEVVGGLDIRRVAAAGDVTLSGLRFDGPILLAEARLRNFAFNQCALSGVLDARSARVEGDLMLSFANIPDEHKTPSNIGAGSLDVQGRLIVEGAPATTFAGLDLRDCRIGRSAKIRTLSVEGEIDLVNARVGGDLTFGNPNGGDRVIVGEGNGDLAGVKLNNASIDGDLGLLGLSIHGPTLRPPAPSASDGVALEIRGAKVGGSLKLGASKPESVGGCFEATAGSVLIHTSKIGGDLQCAGAFIGGFNEDFFNSLSIYNCTIGGKLGISKFRRTSGAVNVDLNRGAHRYCAHSTKMSAGDAWRLSAPIACRYARPGCVSPRIVVFQTKAAILEVGKKEDVSDDCWSIFDIEENQITLSATTYERLEESELDSQRWKELLDKNTRFTDRHRKGCKRRNCDSVTQCKCQEQSDFDADSWTQAARVLEAEGMDDEARELRYHREQRRFAADKKSLKRDRDAGRHWSLWWRRLLWWFVGFGFKPFLFVRHIVGAYILAFIAFQIAYFCEHLAASGEEPPAFFAFTYALDAMLPILEFEQTNVWRPEVWGFALLEAAVSIYGWTAFTLAAVSLTSLLKKT